MTSFSLKDYNCHDTIAAIATFPSTSALGVVKISGKKSFSIVSKIFKPAHRKKFDQVKTFTLHYGWIVEKAKPNGRPRQKGVIDEVLVSVMRKPHSYTTEDVIEISSHGGTVILNKILDTVLSRGARLALPGEFTYRALVGGRIDLLQAESILGIVQAKTAESAMLASSQLGGTKRRYIDELKEKIKELFIQTEAAINFPEEDIAVSHSQMLQKIRKFSQAVDELLVASREAEILKEGLKCVICGKANVGKSTLFNCLLRRERVIVSRLPGTTRDVVEETINIKGVPLRIYDTAGILEPRDLVAKKALEKTAQVFEEADVVILILDGSRPLDKDDFFLLEKIKDKNIILIINKIDLKSRIDMRKIKGVTSVVKMSAIKAQGLVKLEEAVYNTVYKGTIKREHIIFLSQFQRSMLKETEIELKEIQRFLGEQQPLDFINVSLRRCLENLGKLTGEVFSQEILESIFSQFCIGK